MARRVEDFVSSNNRGVGRLEGYMVGASAERAMELSFSGINCMVRVEAAVYERSRGDNLLVGSPKPEHGIGRGGVGVQYGDWAEVLTEESGIFTVDGRQTVVDSLRGIENGIHSIAVGSGSTSATRSDTSLEDEEARRRSWRLDTGPTEVTAANVFSSLHSGALSEAGVIDREGRLMCRVLFGDVNPPTDGVADYRVELTLTFESQTLGDSVLTDVGLEAISDSVSRSEVVVGIDRALIGTSETAPDPSDTALGALLDEKTVEREHQSDSVAVRTVWFEDEPAGHPHTLREVGLEDNEGRLIWRTVFDPEEKTDDLPVIVGARIRII